MQRVENVRHPQRSNEHSKLHPEIPNNITPCTIDSLFRSSRISGTIVRARLIQFSLLGPDFLNAPPVAARLVPVPLRPVVALCGETAVHFAFDLVAVAKSFVYESTGVAFVERCHDLLAVFALLVLATLRLLGGAELGARSGLRGTHTDVVWCVQVRMHLGGGYESIERESVKSGRPVLM